MCGRWRSRGASAQQIAWRSATTGARSMARAGAARDQQPRRPAPRNGCGARHGPRRKEARPTRGGGGDQRPEATPDAQCCTAVHRPGGQPREPVLLPHGEAVVERLHVDLLRDRLWIVVGFGLLSLGWLFLLRRASSGGLQVHLHTVGPREAAEGQPSWSGRNIHELSGWSVNSTGRKCGRMVSNDGCPRPLRPCRLCSRPRWRPRLCALAEARRRRSFRASHLHRSVDRREHRRKWLSTGPATQEWLNVAKTPRSRALQPPGLKGERLGAGDMPIRRPARAVALDRVHAGVAPRSVAAELAACMYGQQGLAGAPRQQPCSPCTRPRPAPTCHHRPGPAR